jgi:hypothetical protein
LPTPWRAHVAATITCDVIVTTIVQAGAWPAVAQDGVR